MRGMPRTGGHDGRFLGSIPAEADSGAARPVKWGINRFKVRVAENGDTWIERLRW